MPTLEQWQEARRIVQQYRRGEANYDNTLKRLHLRDLGANDFRDILDSLEAAEPDPQPDQPPAPTDGAALINGLLREHHQQAPVGQHQDRNDQMNEFLRRASGR